MIPGTDSCVPPAYVPWNSLAAINQRRQFARYRVRLQPFAGVRDTEGGQGICNSFAGSDEPGSV